MPPAPTQPMTALRLLLTVAAIARVLSIPAHAADKAGAKDFPAITRFKGAEIVEYQATDFDEAVLPVKPVPLNPPPATSLLRVEGKVTDITYVPTDEGWLYVAVVIDLYSRAVVGWSMQGHIRTELVLDAMLMAKWRRQPKQTVVIHSDQGSQFGSDDFNRWCKENNFMTSMSRRGNCYDNAAMEPFFSSLKKEKTRGKVYNTREELKAEIFEYIEVFYNRVRRHSYLNYLSPVQFEQQQFGH